MNGSFDQNSNGLFGPMQNAQRSSLGAGGNTGVVPPNGPGMRNNRWGFGDTPSGGGDVGPGPAPGGGMGGGGALPLGPMQGLGNGGQALSYTNTPPTPSPLYSPINDGGMGPGGGPFGTGGGPLPLGPGAEGGMGGGGFVPMGAPHGGYIPPGPPGGSYGPVEGGKFGPMPDPRVPIGGGFVPMGSPHGFDSRLTGRPPYTPPGPWTAPPTDTGGLAGIRRPPDPYRFDRPQAPGSNLFSPMPQAGNPALMNPWLRNYLMQRRGY